MFENNQNIRCNFCVLSSQFENLKFNCEGRCNACSSAEILYKEFQKKQDREKDLFEKKIEQIKIENSNKEYDVIVGLSGGVDSCYVAHLASKKYQLRVLALHIDSGWNTELAIGNIERMITALNIDLRTIVIDWESIREVQRAFMLSGVLCQDIPQDHAYFASIYKFIIESQLKYFFSGVNFLTENISPAGWGHPYMDARHIKAIYQQFRRNHGINKFPFFSLFDLIENKQLRGRIDVLKPLDINNYNKQKAKLDLKNLYGWRDYGEKHSESQFTKFYQEIYLPKKFKINKEELHLSSLIVSEQITRQQAIKVLETPQEKSENNVLEFVGRKLEFTPEELMALLEKPGTKHNKFANNIALYSAVSNASKMFNYCKLLMR